MSEPTRPELDEQARQAGVPSPEDLPNKDAVAEAIEQVQNPALEPPDPPEPEAQTYEVTGTQRVLDHDPGDTFTAILTPDQEAFYLAGGHLTKQEKEDA